MFRRVKAPQIKPVNNNVWPQDGDVYFWVRSDIGQICSSEWSDDGPYHQFRKDTGNCFRTRAEAREAIEEVKSFVLWKERPE